MGSKERILSRNTSHILRIMKTHPSNLKTCGAFAACLLLGTTLGFEGLAFGNSPRNTSGTSPSVALASYELGYNGPSSLFTGTNIPSYLGLLVINRPSPGDNSWYRLPYTVEITGALPPGLSLVQNTGNGDLARIEGTPTEAGTFTVQLRGIMEDGFTTSTTALTFTIADPRNSDLKPTLWPCPPKPEGISGILGAVGFQSSASYTFANLGSLLTVETEGLPEGIKVDPASAEDPSCSFYLVGTAKEGTYPYVLRFKWADGQPFGEVTGTLEILPADAAKVYSITSYFGPPLRRGNANPAQPFFWLWNGGGEYVDSVNNQAVAFEIEGLPEGLSYQDRQLRGTPQQSGTFSITVYAKDSEGNELAKATFGLEVQEPISAAQAAGTFDSLVDRSPLNNDTGGRLLLTLTRAGRVTGTLIHKFQRYPFNSRNASFTGGNLRITPPNSGLVIEGSIEDSGETESFDLENEVRIPSYVFGGLIRESSTEDTSIAAVSGRRAVTKTAADPSPYASPNRVNLIFVRNPWSGEGQPAGTGFLSYRVAPTGVVTGTYWGADGSAPVSVATRISHTDLGGQFPLYLVTQNDSGKGSLSASLFLNANGDSAGLGSFFQPASNRGSFPDGISMVNYTGVIGSRYIQQPDNLNLLGLEEGIQNAELELEGAGLDEDLEVPVTVGNNSIAASATPEVSAVQLKLDRKTGIVTGTMRVNTEGTQAPQTVQFRAMSNAQSGGAVGHFITRGTSKTIKAGAIQLVPKSN